MAGEELELWTEVSTPISINASNSSSITVWEKTFYFWLWKVASPIIFLAVGIMGVCGNVMVICIVLRIKSMRTNTNYLLLNLAFADLSFVITCVPFTTYKFIAENWHFGDISGNVICRSVSYVLYVTAYVTVYTLVAISVQRYRMVVHQTTPTLLSTVLTITAIWLVFTLLNIPILLVHKVKQIQDYKYCGMDGFAVKPVFTTFFIFAYALPLSVIVVLYLNIVVYLYFQSRRMDNVSSRDRTNHVLKVTLVVIFVFAACWLPSHVNNLVSVYGVLPNTHWYEVLRIIWNVLSYGNSCANPLIYHYVCNDFRKHFKTILCPRKATRQQRSHDGITEVTANERMTMLNNDGQSTERNLD